MSPNRFFTPSSLKWCSLRYKANGTYPIIPELVGIFNSNNKKIYAKSNLKMNILSFSEMNIYLAKRFFCHLVNTHELNSLCESKKKATVRTKMEHTFFN